MKYFSEKDLKSIRDSTIKSEERYAYVFIAEKIKSEIKEVFEELNSIQNDNDRLGKLSDDIIAERSYFFEQLMKELRDKSLEDFNAIYFI